MICELINIWRPQINLIQCLIILEWWHIIHNSQDWVLHVLIHTSPSLCLSLYFSTYLHICFHLSHIGCQGGVLSPTPQSRWLNYSYSGNTSSTTPLDSNTKKLIHQIFFSSPPLPHKHLLKITFLNWFNLKREVEA